MDYCLTCTVPAGTLRLDFLWHSDRYVQQLQWIDTAGTAHLILVSREGTEADEWPASPPIQQLLIEQHPLGLVALGVGQSGRSHWSTSIQAIDGEGFRFDLACRVGDGVPHLQSAMRQPAVEAAQRVVPRITVSDESELREAATDCDWVVVPRSECITGKKTIQWSYRLSAEAAFIRIT